jgi:hypothetical protein
MVKAASLSTETSSGARIVRLSTRLPERAAPNLALASHLTWDESTRVDRRGTQSVATRSKMERKRKPIVERLRTTVDGDLRRMPLEAAFLQIGEQSGVRFEVDGAALKLSGYTKNMEQTFRLGKIAATEMLWQIVKQYEEMVLVIDETNNRVKVTTRPVAAEQGLKPMKLGPQ